MWVLKLFLRKIVFYKEVIFFSCTFFSPHRLIDFFSSCSIVAAAVGRSSCYCLSLLFMLWYVAALGACDEFLRQFVPDAALLRRLGDN